MADGYPGPVGTDKIVQDLSGALKSFNEARREAPVKGEALYSDPSHMIFQILGNDASTSLPADPIKLAFADLYTEAAASGISEQHRQATAQDFKEVQTKINSALVDGLSLEPITNIGELTIDRAKGADGHKKLFINLQNGIVHDENNVRYVETDNQGKIDFSEFKPVTLTGQFKESVTLDSSNKLIKMTMADGIEFERKNDNYTIRKDGKDVGTAVYVGRNQIGYDYLTKEDNDQAHLVGIFPNQNGRDISVSVDLRSGKYMITDGKQPPSEPVSPEELQTAYQYMSSIARMRGMMVPLPTNKLPETKPLPKGNLLEA